MRRRSIQAHPKMDACISQRARGLEELQEFELGMALDEAAVRLLDYPDGPAGYGNEENDAEACHKYISFSDLWNRNVPMGLQRTPVGKRECCMRIAAFISGHMLLL